MAGQIWDGAFEIDYGREYDVEVVSYEASAGIVVLDAPGNDDLQNPGIFGLEWEGGYGRLGEVFEVDGSRATRRLEILEGEPPGSMARIGSFAFPGDPLAAHGIAFEEVTYPAEQGPLPAWLVPAEGDTWMITVHGNTADRREALRLLPEFHERGLPVLVITYRNDREVEVAAGATFAYGSTEWADLEGAVRYALDAGAEDVILLGYSMGGAIVTSFLYRSDLADSVRAAILDSPALNLADAADAGMRDGGVPGFLTGALRGVASLRYGIDWSDFDHLRRAEELEPPILLVHGDGDDVAPVTSSRQLAERRPDLVTYVELAGVGHVRGWNEAHEEYLAAIDAFLDRVLTAEAAVPR